MGFCFEIKTIITEADIIYTSESELCGGGQKHFFGKFSIFLALLPTGRLELESVGEGYLHKMIVHGILFQFEILPILSNTGNLIRQIQR